MFLFATYTYFSIYQIKRIEEFLFLFLKCHIRCIFLRFLLFKDRHPIVYGDDLTSYVSFKKFKAVCEVMNFD